MASLPKRVESRLITGSTKFQPVLAMARSKDAVAIFDDRLVEPVGGGNIFPETDHAQQTEIS
jgi:hypothetical protein